jgi:hypothetical protein
LNAHEAPASARPDDARVLARDRPPFDISTAHPARVYDFLLGGKDNISQEVRAVFRDRA